MCYPSRFLVADLAKILNCAWILDAARYGESSNKQKRLGYKYRKRNRLSTWIFCQFYIPQLLMPQYFFNYFIILNRCQILYQTIALGIHESSTL
jgi:hypothetical protein